MPSHGPPWDPHNLGVWSQEGYEKNLLGSMKGPRFPQAQNRRAAPPEQTGRMGRSLELSGIERQLRKEGAGLESAAEYQLGTSAGSTAGATLGAIGTALTLTGVGAPIGVVLQVAGMLVGGGSAGASFLGDRPDVKKIGSLQGRRTELTKEAADLGQTGIMQVANTADMNRTMANYQKKAGKLGQTAGTLGQVATGLGAASTAANVFSSLGGYTGWEQPAGVGSYDAMSTFPPLHTVPQSAVGSGLTPAGVGSSLTGTVAPALTNLVGGLTPVQPTPATTPAAPSTSAFRIRPRPNLFNQYFG